VTSAFGGQHSIQLSYGRVAGSIARRVYRGQSAVDGCWWGGQHLASVLHRGTVGYLRIVGARRGARASP
jgi:hypothetical protein